MAVDEDGKLHAMNVLEYASLNFVQIAAVSLESSRYNRRAAA
jgi:hypothetical protein